VRNVAVLENEGLSGDERMGSGRLTAAPAGGAGNAAERAREAGLIERIRQGDVDLFEHFVKTYQKRVFRLVYTLVRDAAEADATTQDVFVKAFKGLPDFKGEAAFETWITRIAINSVRDSIRRRKPSVPFGDLGGGEGGDELPAAYDPGDGTSPERDLLSREIRKRIGLALVDLSPRQRSVFVMKHYEEKSIAEIGEVTGLDEGTVKSHLFRAARKLRERLEDLR
jgi:RNA polymerase sigma-70 factor (ECF subfamily)